MNGQRGQVSTFAIALLMSVLVIGVGLSARARVGVEDLTEDFIVTAPGISPSYVAGIIIVIIIATTILYFGWKGKIPEMYPEIGDEI